MRIGVHRATALRVVSTASAISLFVLRPCLLTLGSCFDATHTAHHQAAIEFIEGDLGVLCAYVARHPLLVKASRSYDSPPLGRYGSARLERFARSIELTAVDRGWVDSAVV